MLNQDYSTQEYINYFKNDRWAETADVDIVKVDHGYALVKMPVSDKHLNSIKTVQGGAIFTLADYAFAIASNTYGNIAVALNVSISFLRPAVHGDTLFAEAIEESCGTKISSYKITITNSREEVIGIFNGMAYRKKDKIPVKKHGTEKKNP
jgi:acyl-CoA thioesterase